MLRAEKKGKSQMIMICCDRASKKLSSGKMGRDHLR